jgi:hypothetical protein
VIEDLKILSVRFIRPVQLKGAGMVDHLELGPDPETGKPLNEGITATWFAAARAIRVSTPKGETWVPEGTIASLQPLYEQRAGSNTPVAKRTAK